MKTCNASDSQDIRIRALDPLKIIYFKFDQKEILSSP